MRLFAVALVLFLAACGDDPPAPPASTTAPPSTVAAPTPPPSSAAPPSTATPPATTTAHAEHAPPLDAEHARAYRRALRAARAAHHDGHDDEAVRQYEAAFAIANDGRALCELGWIHFQAQRYDAARTAMTRAMAILPSASPVPERFVAPVGACFYNLGRLEEQEGHVAEARQDYERSLEVRPGNAVVTARLAALTAPAPIADAPTGPHQCGASGATPIADVDGWITRVGALSGRPEAFDAVLAELGLEPVDPEAILDGSGTEDDDARLDAHVTSGALRLSGGASARYVHVVLAAGDNRFDRLVVLRPVSGGHCIVGTDAQDQDACSTSCLTSWPVYRITLDQLVAEDVDALRVDTSEGACACGSERGSHDRTRYLGVEGDTLTTYLEVTRFSAWYDSPTPPIEEESAEITLGETYPCTITVVSETSCEDGCSTAEVAARRTEIDAMDDEDERADAEDALEQDCGYYISDCDESRETHVYAYRDHAYVE